MTEKRDTDRVPAPDAEALLSLLDGLSSRGLLGRCTRVDAGGASVLLGAPGAPVPERDPEREKALADTRDLETLFEAS